MEVKFLDLFSQIKPIRKKIFSSIIKNIKESNFIGGKDLINFEKNFSKFLSIKYCLGVANGTDALEIAINSLNLKKNSEVIVPANTWISAAESVINNGLKIKFCDIDETHNMCPKDLKLKINKNTSAVIVVHLYGNPAKINEIFKICKINNIKLIEDCAQGHGASVDHKKVGTFGDISTFSFFPSKNLGCFGDGGAIVTDNKKLFKICKKISHHGGLKKNQHIIVGRNSRLDNIQAGILDIKLKKLNSWIQLRRKQGSFYKKNLNNVGDIKFIHQVQNTCHSNHLFVIKTKSRNKLKKYLYNKKIYTNIHYPKTLPELPVFRRQHLQHCQNMKALISNKEILSLPIGEHLTFKHLRYVCLEITKFFSKC